MVESAHLTESAPVVVVEAPRGPGLLVRALWYLFIGWWLTGLSLVLGYLAGLTIVGLPLSFYVFNRTGTLLTLRPRTQQIVIQQEGGVVRVSPQHRDQRPLLLRAVYFILIGWWAALIWMMLAYVVSLTVVLLPVGVMMLNRLPEVYTLHRN